MYHSNWVGSHYDAGLQYGKDLHQQGIQPMAIHPETSFEPIPECRFVNGIVH